MEVANDWPLRSRPRELLLHFRTPLLMFGPRFALQRRGKLSIHLVKFVATPLANLGILGLRLSFAAVLMHFVIAGVAAAARCHVRLAVGIVIRASTLILQICG